MHCIVSWDIRGVDDSKWQEINIELKVHLDKYLWIRPLTTFYIIPIDSVKEYETMTNDLVDIARKYQENIALVISPIMQGGSYQGWLTQGLWGAINERTRVKGLLEALRRPPVASKSLLEALGKKTEKD